VRALSALAGIGRREASLENPSTAITGQRLLSEVTDPGTLWSTTSGQPTKIGAAYRCVQIIAQSVAGCPVQVRRRSDKQVIDVPALSSERGGTTPFEMWETTVAHIALQGNAFLRKMRTRDGRVLALLPIHPARVEVKVVDATEIGVPFAKLFVIDGRISDPLTERDVMHIPGLSLDGIMGISVISHLRQTFDLAASAERMANKFYDQGMLLSGFLSTPSDLNQEKAGILKDRWRAKLTGIDSAYDVAVLDKGAKFEKLSMSPSDAQFLETRKFSTTEIARLFGIPGWMINDQEKSTSWGTGMEQQWRTFVQITLQGYMQRIEQRLVRELADPATDQVKFKVEGLLRGDSVGRAAFYSSAITNGWMVPNEVRGLEDLEPVDWGNEPYLPHNTSAEAQTTPDPSGGSDAAA